MTRKRAIFKFFKKLKLFKYSIPFLIVLIAQLTIRLISWKIDEKMIMRRIKADMYNMNKFKVKITN